MTSHVTNNTIHKYELYIKYSIATYNVILFTIIFLIALNTILNFFFKKNFIMEKILKYINLFFICVILALTIFKFIISLKVENVLGSLVYDMKLAFFTENNNLGILQLFTNFTTTFSDAILLLALIIGLLCVDLLGPKNLLKNITNINVFFFFIFFVTIMITTNNLLIMFVSFEFIFLPTIYYAYTLGYSKKIDRATEVLVYWTLLGSFLVLCNLAYIYYKTNTLNYLFVTKIQFSQSEVTFLVLNIFVGFGIKIPLVPFHYWLLKVHVESPTAFSIFLSGFLVKSALYCLFILLNIFLNNDQYNILIIWVMYSLIIGTLGLSRQTDIKKLIAWATVQEMSFILCFLILKQNFLNHVWVIFVVLHGIMSAYMFFFIDILQRRFKTRSFQSIQSVNLLAPKLIKYVWFLIFLFSGFPLTAKFFIEWDLISTMMETEKFVMLFTLAIVNITGTLFFCKIIFSIIYGVYGTHNQNFEKVIFFDIQQKEERVLNYLSFLTTWLLLLIYII